MSPKWLRPRKSRVDPVELAETAEVSLKETRKQQAHVNALAAYLNNRTGQNGFGEDFEITLTPRRA